MVTLYMYTCYALIYHKVGVLNLQIMYIVC